MNARVFDNSPRREITWGAVLAVLFVVVVSGFTACAGQAGSASAGREPHPDASGTLTPEDAERVLKRAHREHLIAGMGVAAGRDEATRAATIQALAGVYLEVDAKIEDFRRTLERSGISTVIKRQDKSVKTRVRSDLGAFFKSIASGVHDGRWYVVVATSRKDLEAAIEARAEVLIAEAEQVWRSARASLPVDQMLRLECQTAATDQELDILELERIAIANRRIWNAGRLRRRAEAQRVLWASKQRTAVLLRPTHLRGADNPSSTTTVPDLSSRIAAELRVRGWNVELAVDCREHDHQAVKIGIDVASRCELNAFGEPYCTASTVLERAECNEHGKSAVVTVSGRARADGVHPHDTVRALANAFDALAREMRDNSEQVDQVVDLLGGCGQRGVANPSRTGSTQGGGT